MFGVPDMYLSEAERPSDIMNQERPQKFMRDFDKVLEKLRETVGVDKINKLKEYPEIFHVEEVNTELERIIKHIKG